MAQPGGLTCSHGHPWSRANTRRDRNGHRQCIACERRRSRQCRARRRARAKPVEQHERHGSRPSSKPAESVAAVLCDSGYSHASHVAVTRFDDVAAALAFAARLPCDSPHCAQLHILAWRERGGQLGGVRIFGQPAPPPLAVELFMLYPRSGHPEPVAWPAPVVLNEPLPPPRGTH